jgi:peroxiredoxin
MSNRSLGLVVAALVIAIVPAAIGQSSAGLKARLDAIAAAQEKVRERYHHDREGAAAEAPQLARERFLKETARNTEEVLTLVAARPDDPAVVEALKFVIKTAKAGPGDESYRAMEILLRDHVRDPGMSEICGRIFYFVHVPVAESLLRAVLEQHPNRHDRGEACHALAQYLEYQAYTVRVIRAKPARIGDWVHERHKESFERFVKEADPAALEKQSEALLERVVAEFADVKDWYDERPLGTIAVGELFRLRNLAVGKIAPEIEGKDHEGRSFALRDYRGKVVVLTFSGNWCGPCVGMYPHERDLIAKLKDKPFALVSVNTDANVETLKTAITTGEITWRCWWDGGTTGPITTRWGILSFPSIFILDKSGVIRFKDLRGEDLDKAVVLLLDEAPAETPSRQ